MDIKKYKQIRPVKDVLLIHIFLYWKCITYVFWGLEGEEPRRHLALSTPPPFLLAHADQLINSVLKKAKQKVFDPLTSEETRNADSVFSIVRARAFGYHHELLDCQQINQSVYSICCHSNISLGPWTNQLPKLYLCNQEWIILAFDWCNLVCSSFFQHLNVKVIY